jgi:hypothetical protein
MGQRSFFALSPHTAFDIFIKNIMPGGEGVRSNLKIQLIFQADILWSAVYPQTNPQ